MNRQMRRASAKIGRSMMKLPVNEFEDITVEARMKTQFALSNYPDKVWKNNHYSVQLFRRDRVMFGVQMDKLMIRRHDAEKIKEWHDLQEIKNRIAGVESVAFQVFPPKSQLVDVANMYWLFIETGKL